MMMADIVLTSRTLDYGLEELNQYADKLYVCSQQPVDYTEATATYALGLKDLGVGLVFGSPANATPDGRQVSSVEIVDGSISTAGTVAAWAAVDSVNSRLLATGILTGGMAVRSGQGFKLGVLTVRVTSTGEIIPFPLEGAAVDLKFTSSEYYDGASVAVTTLLSCTRASTGYAQTAAGTLTSFAANTLRITDLGLLVEDARTNYAHNSEDFSQWTNVTGATVTTNTTVAPNGQTTADTIAFAVNDYRYQGIISVPIATQNCTFSVWFKGTAGQKIGLRMYDGAAATIFYTVVTLTSSWERYSLTGNLNISDGSANLGFENRSIIDAQLGIGAVTLQAWGGQFEIGAFASSYIPTTSASATRAADAVTITSTLQSTIAAATGSILAQVNNGKLAGIASNVVDSNGTNLLGFDATNHGLASLVATLATSNTANRTSQDKLGIAWNASGRSLVLNSSTVATDSSAQTPSSTQHIGSSGSANFMYAYIERLTAWNTRLADATLQTLTAP